MVRRMFKFTVLAVVFSSLFSCASTSEFDALDKSARSYERAIRWGEFARAKAFHKGDPVLHDIERRRLKFYRVTGYNTLSNQTPDSNNSYVLVEVKYYKNDRPVIKTISVKQHWKREEKTGIWYLDTPFPTFK